MFFRKPEKKMNAYDVLQEELDAIFNAHEDGKLNTDQYMQMHERLLRRLDLLITTPPASPGTEGA